jgi:hypothetical protein
MYFGRPMASSDLKDATRACMRDATAYQNSCDCVLAVRRDV